MYSHCFNTFVTSVHAGNAQLREVSIATFATFLEYGGCSTARRSVAAAQLASGESLWALPAASSVHTCPAALQVSPLVAFRATPSQNTNPSNSARWASLTGSGANERMQQQIWVLQKRRQQSVPRST